MEGQSSQLASGRGRIGIRQPAVTDSKTLVSRWQRRILESESPQPWHAVKNLADHLAERAEALGAEQLRRKCKPPAREIAERGQAAWMRAILRACRVLSFL